MAKRRRREKERVSVKKTRVGLGFGEESWREGIVGFCGFFLGFGLEEREGGESGGGRRDKEVAVEDWRW